MTHKYAKKSSSKVGSKDRVNKNLQTDTTDSITFLANAVSKQSKPTALFTRQSRTAVSAPGIATWAVT